MATRKAPFLSLRAVLLDAIKDPRRRIAERPKDAAAARTMTLLVKPKYL